MPYQQADTEEQFLKAYDASLYERPNITVDTVIFTVLEQSLHVLLVKRAEFPFKGSWSLVGGYVDINHDHSLEDTAKRKLTQKTGVKTPYLEQLETVGNANRDPRGWSVTTVYFALIPSAHIQLKSGQGATDTQWVKVINGRVESPLAFDHADILSRSVQRLRNKVLYTSLPIYLMPESFTLGELQTVYEIILGQVIDSKSFRRRILTSDILEKTGEKRHVSKRPATLYRLKEAAEPHFFVRNIEGAD